MDKIESEFAALEAKLCETGSDDSTRRCLGTFAVAWTLFENRFELLLISQMETAELEKLWIDRNPSLAQWCNALPEILARVPKALATVDNFQNAAINLADYRHAVFHGFYYAKLDATVRNMQWHGVKRSRPSHAAHIEPRLLKMAAIAADGLHQYLRDVARILSGAMSDFRPSTIRGLSNSRSYANELRYLADLMNSDFG